MTMYTWISHDSRPPSYIWITCVICGNVEYVPALAYNQRPKVCPKCGGEWDADIQDIGEELQPFTTQILRKQGVPV